MKIWKEFVALVRAGGFPPDRLKPLAEGYENVLLEYLSVFKKVEPGLWEKSPEIQRNGPLVNFIIAFYDERRPFNFQFIEEGGRWYFRHLEQVLVRLDKTPPPPTSTFPDTDEERKAWAREEIYWSQIVFLYTALVPKLGKQAFLDLLRDGPGYFVGAKSWVPFVPPQRAFVLYMCWDQANLRGMNTRGDCVTLEKLEDNEAVVRFKNHACFLLYRNAAHLKPMISLADYREIFETIWQSRASAAGWDLAVEHLDPNGLEILFRLTR
ncbi:MAG: hypothetical protein OEW05_13895 [Candidatus Aminicenantes bacterium]|nr:hypothetical protein [Candidatus Aminicenantes bacterium]